MKKMFTLLMSLVIFSSLFAQYDKPFDSRGYNNQNAPYNNGGNRNNNYQMQSSTGRRDDGNFPIADRWNNYGHRDDGDRRRTDDYRRNDHEFNRPDYDHDRDDWRRPRHRGLGLLGTGLVVGGIIGIVAAGHH